MNIIQLLKPKQIFCDLGVNSKKALLEFVSATLSDGNSTMFKNQLFDAFIAREQLGSTALGHGVAIPHIRTPLFDQAQMIIIKLREGIEFNAEDLRPVDIIFALIAPEAGQNVHLTLLAECSSLLIEKSFRKQLRLTKTTAEIEHLISAQYQSAHAAPL